VAAILNSFPRCDHHSPRAELREGSHWLRPTWGIAQGGVALLRGSRVCGKWQLARDVLPAWGEPGESRRSILQMILVKT
jgi:hypothetical protein